VGNPLLNELPLKTTRREARHALGLSENQKTVVLMAGSRPSELFYHLHLMLDAALSSAKTLNKTLVVLLPFPTVVDLTEMKTRIERWRASQLSDEASLLDLRPSSGNSAIALLSADAGLIKSGTSTLEAGLLGCVHAVVYQSSWLTHFIFSYFVRRSYKGPVGLINLVMNQSTTSSACFVREFIDFRTSPKRLAQELVLLLEDLPTRARLQKGFLEMRQAMQSDADQGSPSERAASEVVELFKGIGPERC
jgi:lipid-A-disaccharide synthase